MLFELHHLAEELGLCLAWRGWTEVMIGSTYNVVLLGVVEILIEVLIPDTGTFGSFDENEGYGYALYLCVA